MMPVFFKKAFQTIRRDAILYARSARRRRLRPAVRLILSISVVAIVYFAFVLFRHDHPSSTARSLTSHQFGSLTVRTTHCACPLLSTSKRFTNALLQDSHFVARIKRASASSSSENGTTRMRIHTLYRGHIAAIHHPLIIPNDTARACFSGRHHSLFPISDHWLIVSGPLARMPLASSQQLYVNASLPTPLQLPHAHCKPGDSFIVWLTPWHLLSPEVQTYLRSDDGALSQWWRTVPPWFDFADSMHRASNISRDSSALALTYPHERSPLQGEWWLQGGVSIVTACKDRTEMLSIVLPLWLAAHNISEIVIVDWSSQSPVASTLPSKLTSHPKIIIIRVEHQEEWILTRAYNLAIRAATSTLILKLDCDSDIAPDFVAGHPLQRNQFYTGNWKVLGTGPSNALHANGILFAFRDDVLGVGGYDERVVTYGWDDTDLAMRLARVRVANTIHYEKVRHLPHSATLRTSRQKAQTILPADHPQAAAVEVQRNRLLVSKFGLPKWRAASIHVSWNIKVDEYISKSRLLVASPGNHVPALASLVSDADATDVAKRAVRLILHRYGVPMLPKSLSLDFYKALSLKVARPDLYADVVLSLNGGLASRLLALVSLQMATSKEGDNDMYVRPPSEYLDWRIQVLWQAPDSQCRCSYFMLFRLDHDEIVPTWNDVTNPIPKAPVTRYVNGSSRAHRNVRDVLGSFDEFAKPKNLTGDLLHWWSTGANNSHIHWRSLITNDACDDRPDGVPKQHLLRKRQLLQQLIPHENVVEAVAKSLRVHEAHLLDSVLLSSLHVRKIVGTLYLEEIEQLYASPQVKAIASTWSQSSTALMMKRPMRRLLDRARAVSYVMRMASFVGMGQEHVEASAPLRELIADVSKRVDSMFLGCPAHASNYLLVFPELSIIIAAVLSTQLCK